MSLPSTPPPMSQKRQASTKEDDNFTKRRRTKPSSLDIGKVVKVVCSPRTPLPASPASRRTHEMSFQFLELPGEIRNRIYEITLEKMEQALVKHLPRLASLRPRKYMPDSKRKTKRPYFALTQVCRQVRWEYRPMFMRKQEIGIDLTQVNHYLSAFYLSPGSLPIGKDDGRLGNLTVALSGRAQRDDQNPHGVDVWSLLKIWANSQHIEGGFGRYHHIAYNARSDGEAKDMYRLFGRRVLPSRQCGPLNEAWRDTMCDRKLAHVRIHRFPQPTERPFIHILFKPEHREAWMTAEVSVIPHDWLMLHGFSAMEYFNVKVGAVGVNSVVTKSR